MLHSFFFNEDVIIHELMKDMGFKAEEKKSSIEDTSLFKGIKNRINELG